MLTILEKDVQTNQKHLCAHILEKETAQKTKTTFVLTCLKMRLWLCKQITPWKTKMWFKSSFYAPAKYSSKLQYTPPPSPPPGPIHSNPTFAPVTYVSDSAILPLNTEDTKTTVHIKDSIYIYSSNQKKHYGWWFGSIIITRIWL